MLIYASTPPRRTCTSARILTAHQESVLLPGVPVISVEAGTVFGWSKYAHGSIGMNSFGASGPAPVRSFA